MGRIASRIVRSSLHPHPPECPAFPDGWTEGETITPDAAHAAEVGCPGLYRAGQLTDLNPAGRLSLSATRLPRYSLHVAIDVAFIARIDSPRFCEKLFAVLPDVMFCLKDTDRCYRAVNQAFVERIGLKDTRRLIGRHAEEFFPAALADVYREQDEQVLGTGTEIVDQLELSLNRDGSQGWYLATKVPLHDRAGKIVGLASVSRDLRAPRAGDAELAGIAKVAEHIRDHLDEPLRAGELAAIAGLSPTQLERRMQRVFQLSTTQFVRKSRIENAARLLRDTPMAIADVALECGYGDQTALTRQFRSMVGMPPAAYRDYVRKLP